MRFFRVYELDRTGGIKETHFVQAENETAALVTAKKLLPMRELEMWDQSRLVGCVDPTSSLSPELSADGLGNSWEQHAF